MPDGKKVLASGNGDGDREKGGVNGGESDGGEAGIDGGGVLIAVPL